MKSSRVIRVSDRQCIPCNSPGFNPSILLQAYLSGGPFENKEIPVYNANEGPVRIQYKCLVLIYAFPEIKLHGLVISKTELQCSVSQFPHSITVNDLYIPRIGLPHFAAAK